MQIKECLSGTLNKPEDNISRTFGTNVNREHFIRKKTFSLLCIDHVTNCISSGFIVAF